MLCIVSNFFVFKGNIWRSCIIKKDFYHILDLNLLLKLDLRKPQKVISKDEAFPYCSGGDNLRGFLDALLYHICLPAGQSALDHINFLFYFIVFNFLYNLQGRQKLLIDVLNRIKLAQFNI